MRGAVLLILVLIAAIIGLLRPKVALLCYLAFGLLRPDYIAFSMGQHSYSMILAVSVLVGSWRLLFRHSLRAWLLNPICWILVLLQIPIMLSTFVAIYPEASREMYVSFLKACVMALWIPLIITTLSEMKQVLLVTVLSLGAHGFWQAFGGIVRGGAPIRHGIGGFMSENNTFAIGLVMLLPLCWACWSLAPQKWMKMGLLGVGFCCSLSILLTHSRGAAIAFAVTLVCLLLISKRKSKGLLLAAFIVSPALYIVKDTYFDRLKTVQNYEEDNSSMSRIVQMRAAWALSLANPLLGVGFGDENYFAASDAVIPDEDFRSKRLIVHNSFLQILVHCGFVALFLFLFLLGYCMARMIRSSHRLKLSHPELCCIPQALTLSLLAYIIASLAHPRMTFDFMYEIAMFCAAWLWIERDLLLADLVPALAIPEQESCPSREDS